MLQCSFKKERAAVISRVSLVGALLAVLGLRQLEEVNYLYFENKSVSPLALFISGGYLSESSVPRIERFIEENLKGKRNFHKILILEAEGSGQGESCAKIELRPLTEAQQQDALFQLYDERNIDKVGGSTERKAEANG